MCCSAGSTAARQRSEPAQHLHPRRAASMALQALERLDIAQTALQRGRHALGRPAAARRHRPRADAGAEDDARRRADRLARSAQRQDRHGLAARRSTSEQGITVITNLHTLDTARNYCERIIGMAGGRVVFDGTPDELTADAAREHLRRRRPDGGVLGSHDLDQPRAIAPRQQKLRLPVTPRRRCRRG